jgi:hypothetical protein
LENPPPYTEADDLVFDPANWDNVNWLINQGFLGQELDGCDGVVTPKDIQDAIWFLLDDFSPEETCRSKKLQELALAIDDVFVPGCGDKILVAFDPNLNGDEIQEIAIEIEYPCAEEETSWGYGHSEDDPVCVKPGFPTEPPGNAFYKEFDGSGWGWFFYGCNYVPPTK